MANKKVDPSAPYAPAPWEPADAKALQALSRGEADEDQQKRALDWIIHKACMTYDWPYRPGDNDRDTNVGLGRQFVGKQIVKLVNVDLLAIRQNETSIKKLKENT